MLLVHACMVPSQLDAKEILSKVKAAASVRATFVQLEILGDSTRELAELTPTSDFAEQPRIHVQCKFSSQKLLSARRTLSLLVC